MCKSAQDWIDGIREYSEAWSILDERYGNVRTVSDSILGGLANIKPIPEANFSKFTDLYHQVCKARNILCELNRAADLDNSTTLSTIEQKLHYSDRVKWA